MIVNLVFLLLNIITKNECYIKIPFIYFPSNIKKDNSPRNILLSIIDLKMFGLLEIGSPKQLIHIPINFGSNTFFMPEKSSFNKNDIKYNISLYDNKNSSSYKIIKDNEEYEGENFIEAYYVNDIFYFNEEQIDLDFYLTTSYYFPQLGGLGLQLYPSNKANTATPDINKTFLRKLKIKSIANNYIWSVFYGNDFNNNGYLLIGEYPHLSINFPNDNKYNYSLNSIDAIIYDNKIVETKFRMNKVQILYEDKIEENYDDIFIVELDYNFGGILAPGKFKPYFEKNVFNQTKYCKRDAVNRIFNNYFYYCENNENTINELKKLFPLIKFENKILSSTFIININNLLYYENNYIYILLLFKEDSESYTWTLGTPFLKKYQFSINEESKKIYFYKKAEIKDNKERNETNNFFLIIIISICVLLFVLGICLGIAFYYKNTRKKRKNELDDDFDYIIKDGENNAIIN